jgi:hypothetical protein
MITNNSMNMVPTVPETLDVSNVSREKDSKLNEKGICGTYSCGPRSLSHRQQVTLNIDSQLNQPTVSSTDDNVKESAPCHRPKKPQHLKTGNYYRQMNETLPRINAEWHCTYQQRPHPKAQVNMEVKNRRVSFTHESAATTLFLETKPKPTSDLRQQWKDFMLLVNDPKRNNGMKDQTIDLLLDICHDCRDSGLEFSFENIQDHCAFGQALSRHVLALLMNIAGGNVSISCPLERPSGNFEYQGSGINVTPASLLRETKHTTNGTRIDDEAYEFGRRWQLFYECILGSGKVTDEQIDAMSDFESDYTHRYGLVDCKRKYIKHFCKQANWPRELRREMVNLFQQSLMDEKAEFSGPVAIADNLIETKAPNTHNQPDDTTFAALAAQSESLNIAGGASKFSAAARLLLHQNTLPRRAVCPEPTVIKPKPAEIDDDTLPLGHEWHLDDKNRRVRRSLRLIYKKERTEARAN